MSGSVVHLISRSIRDITPAQTPTTAYRQLSLFDERPQHRLVCLPMDNLHGRTFSRIFEDLRPRIVLDARAYPYFDLTALDRARAFRLFGSVASQYIHKPLDLRPPSDQRARWKLRSDAKQMITDLVGSNGATQVIFVMLLNGRPDITVFENAIRESSTGDQEIFKVETPEMFIKILTDHSYRTP